MKNKVKILSCTAMLICAVTAQAAAPAAETVRNSEQEAADFLVSKGYMQGDESGNLLLEKTVTRAEFAELLDKSGCIPDYGQVDVDFVDLSPEHWAYESVKKAYAARIITGFPDGTFRPGEAVTYEQALKMAVGGMEVYPHGYVASALEIGVADNVRGLIGEELTRGDAAILIKNMIENKEIKAAGENFVLGGSYLPGGAVGGGGASALSNSLPAVSDSESNVGGGGGAAAPAPGNVINESVSGGSTGGGYRPVYPVIDYPRNYEEYEVWDENIFKKTLTSPLSTFSIDVDTASYSNMRRMLINGNLPESGTVRIEELVNYFDYDLPLPEDGEPFSVTTELHSCPWNENNTLAMISLKGDEISDDMQKGSNLVFLIDTSGSMYSYNKLPLVQRSIGLLLDKLKDEDTVSIVTYAGSAGVALEPTPVSEKDKIVSVLNSLRASGSTAGAAGIETAYRLAEENKVNGNNRIILCTDGDFNVGVTNNQTLEEMISEKRKSGIFLTVLGFGMGNYKDNRMEMLADCGDGNYAYIDTLKEAKKVLADDLNKTLYTIAKDVKLQVEFNPAIVSEYRLIGYENRRLENEDFENDKKDAGEIGAGHSVTVFYELVPETGEPDSGLMYQETALSDSDDLMCVNIRYKEPDGDESILMQRFVKAGEERGVSDNYAFASAVAAFGMMINDSEFTNNITYDMIINGARNSLGDDIYGIRNEFVQLVDLAKYISGHPNRNAGNIPW